MIAIGIALVVGIIVGHVLALIYGHELLVKSSVFYREAVTRGDAAMAMLQQTAKQLEGLGAGKRVVLANDLDKIKNSVGVAAKDFIHSRKG